MLELAAWKRILVKAFSFCFGLELNTNSFLGFFFFFGIYRFFF